MDKEILMDIKLFNQHSTPSESHLLAIICIHLRIPAIHEKQLSLKNVLLNLASYNIAGIYSQLSDPTF